jgi:PAS domain S-box-containing protein
LSKAKILVVEDERITAEDIKAGLLFEGYNVLEICSKGEDAVQKSRELKPDIVLMDIKLEGKMDGIDAAAEIRRLYDIPVIYLTAYTDEKTIERAKKTEPSGFLVKGQGIINKPFEERELHAAIEITLHRDKLEKQHDQLFSTMMKNVSEAVISINSSNKIIFMNAAAEGLIGFKMKEILNKDLADFFLELKPDINKETSLKNAIRSENDPIIHISGSEIKLEGIVTPLKDLNNEISGHVIIFCPKN